MPKKLSIDQFCFDAAQINSTYSRHFDELGIQYAESADIDDLISASVGLIDSISARIATSATTIKAVAVCFPFPDTKYMSRWNAHRRRRWKSGFEPPSIYVIFSEDIFGDGFEQYSFPVILDEFKTVLFRSFRSSEGISNGEEFSNALFVLRRL